MKKLINKKIGIIFIFISIIFILLIKNLPAYSQVIYNDQSQSNYQKASKTKTPTLTSTATLTTTSTSTPTPTQSLTPFPTSLGYNQNNIINPKFFGKIPNDAIKILTGYWGAGGGAVQEDTCTNTNKPYILLSGSMSQVLNPTIPMNIKTCGWKTGDQVKIKIQLPNNTTKTETVTTSSTELDFNYSNPFYSSYGEYKFTFSSSSSSITHTVKYLKPTSPLAFTNIDGTQLILSGFKSNEKVEVFIYEPGEKYDQFEIQGAQNFYVDKNGSLTLFIEFPDQLIRFYLVDGEKSGLIDAQLLSSAKVVEHIPNTNIGRSAEFNCQYSSLFISDITIPDGTIMSPGEKFTKTWAIKNNGSCAWVSNANITFSFLKGELMNASTTTILPKSIFPVEPGEIINISVDFIAPTQSGTYRSYWQLNNVLSYTYNHFGQTPYVEIVVK
jgi:hypothetical protein